MQLFGEEVKGERNKGKMSKPQISRRGWPQRAPGLPGAAEPCWRARVMGDLKKVKAVKIKPTEWKYEENVYMTPFTSP